MMGLFQKNYNHCKNLAYDFRICKSLENSNFEIFSSTKEDP